MNYSLMNHLNNLEILSNFISVIKEQDDHNRMFSYMNILADFIHHNEQYYSISSFMELTDIVVDIIDYCNSNDFAMNRFMVMFSEISGYLMKVEGDIKEKYSLYVSFIGEDKYGIIDRILNKNIKFIKEMKETRSGIKIEECFKIMILSDEISKETIDFSENYDHVVRYDQVMNELFDITQRMYHVNYDYNFLSNAIKRSQEPLIDEIIVGSSYSMYGLNEKSLSATAMNLSLPSQDIYYSILIAKEIIKCNSNVKRCYLGTGYWTFYFDLSKSIKSTAARIEKVYYPIFKESNHYKYDKTITPSNLDQISDPLLKVVFDLKEVYQILNRIVFQSYGDSYFNQVVSRENCREIAPFKLHELDSQKKLELGNVRANQHNKLLKYKDTKYELKSMLGEFIQYLNEHSIELIVVNFPATKYYFNFFDKDFIEDYYETMEDLKEYGHFQLIDIAMNETFDDSDFVDIDHMSDEGTKKTISLIQSLQTRLTTT